MIPLDDLAQAAEDLCRMGFNACHEFVYGPHGCVEGLDIGDDFFPLWELQLPENHDDIARLDFAAVKARRSNPDQHTDWFAQRVSVRSSTG